MNTVDFEQPLIGKMAEAEEMISCVIDGRIKPGQRRVLREAIRRYGTRKGWRRADSGPGRPEANRIIIKPCVPENQAAGAARVEEGEGISNAELLELFGLVLSALIQDMGQKAQSESLTDPAFGKMNPDQNNQVLELKRINIKNRKIRNELQEIFSSRLYRVFRRLKI